MVTRTKKIFVGGLSAPTTLEDVKSYFEQFGPVSKKKKRKQRKFTFSVESHLCTVHTVAYQNGNNVLKNLYQTAGNYLDIQL